MNFKEFNTANMLIARVRETDEVIKIDDYLKIEGVKSNGLHLSATLIKDEKLQSYIKEAFKRYRADLVAKLKDLGVEYE